MAKVRLKDGSIVEIPIQKDWGEDEVQRAIREYKANPDPAETDDWGTYLSKHAASTARGVGAGLSSTVDFLGNTIAVAPRIAYNAYQGQPLLTGFGGDAVRDTFEENAYAQPRGSDYETNAAISEIAGPAIIETALTGSPKTAVIRGPLSAGIGIAGGELGGRVGTAIGGEEGGELGRLLASFVTPAGVSRTGAKIASIKTGLPVVGKVMSAMGLGNPFNLIPKSSPRKIAGQAAAGGGASQAINYEER